MNIKSIPKPLILAALFNASRPLGLGLLHYKPDHKMDEAEAGELLKSQTFFDYLEGRVMKIDLSGDELRTDLYNRDNGDRAAEMAIEHALMKNS